MSIPCRKLKHLKSWKWGFDGNKAHYTGLYPRSWTVYDIEEIRLRLTCRQISPVIPHDYEDSSLPCAVFVWDVVNNSDKDLQVAITFTFQSGCGNKDDHQGMLHNFIDFLLLGIFELLLRWPKHGITFPYWKYYIFSNSKF